MIGFQDWEQELGEQFNGVNDSDEDQLDKYRGFSDPADPYGAATDRIKSGDSPIGSEQDHYGLSKQPGYATMYNSLPKRTAGLTPY